MYLYFVALQNTGIIRHPSPPQQASLAGRRFLPVIGRPPGWQWRLAAFLSAKSRPRASHETFLRLVSDIGDAALLPVHWQKLANFANIRKTAFLACG
ncbi:MAG TPA: hypothetical protein VHX11_06125 [Acidobacteriaceae bacterium]|nr:hypothetical protein [Acidobacteriaceae bacterium]